MMKLEVKLTIYPNELVVKMLSPSAGGKVNNIPYFAMAVKRYIQGGRVTADFARDVQGMINALLDEAVQGDQGKGEST